MCSGVKLVKTAASKLMNLCRCCFMPSEATSKTAYWQPASTAFLRNFLMTKRPGIVMRNVLGQTFSPILNWIDDKEAVLNPAFSKIAIIKCTAVVLPLVPVTPITLIFRLGNLYKIAPKKDSFQWYQFIKNLGINFLSKFL